MSNTPAQVFPRIQTPPDTFPVQRYRPEKLEDQNLDLGIKTIYDRVDTIEQVASQVPDALKGSSISTGALQVTGFVKGVATGLSTLSNVIVSIDAGATPTNLTVTATPNATLPGTFDCYVWKPTAAGDNTPIAATLPATVRWHAWGTK